MNQKGFNAGPADGFIGPQTQAAIIAAQRALGVTANGLPSEAFLSLVRKDLPSSGKIAGGRSLPPCAGDVSIWNNCIGSGKWFVSSVSYSVIYSGEWNNGKPNGTGTSVYINGAKYVGEWLDGKHHGQGTLFAVDGTPVMRGLWVNGSFKPRQ